MEATEMFGRTWVNPVEATSGYGSPAQPIPKLPGTHAKPADTQPKPSYYLEFRFGLHSL